MTAPLSYDRVLGAIKRLWPWELRITRPGGALPAAGDSMVGMELGSIAWVIARAKDRVDAIFDEMFPDTAVESLDRWEKITLRPTNLSSTLAQRRARVISVLRRSGGVQLSRLADALYGVLGLSSPDDVVFFEPLRAQIDAALTIESEILNVTLPTSGSGLLVGLGRAWPGKIDDLGVQVYIETSALGTPTYKLTSPKGTSWTIPFTANGYYENRTLFKGEMASGPWTLSFLQGTGAITLTRCALRVSNDKDAGQIYNFFAWRDMGLSGTPDIPEAQRLFSRSALAHMSPSVITQEEFVVDDSVVDREPVQ